MTTVLADARFGVMVSDSSVTDDDRVWSDRKVFRHKGVLYGFAGNVDERVKFMVWVRGGPVPKVSDTFGCLKLCDAGLFVFSGGMTPNKVTCGYEAVGSGAKAVMCAYEALDFTDPRRAVRIVCKHDSGSRKPVRTYYLKAK